MAILIDEPMWPAHGRLWAHLVSDTDLEELHAFATASPGEASTGTTTTSRPKPIIASSTPARNTSADASWCAASSPRV